MLFFYFFFFYQNVSIYGKSKNIQGWRTSRFINRIYKKGANSLKEHIQQAKRMTNKLKELADSG
jgi:hypothetical protein